jgi:hypothetical protein
MLEIQKVHERTPFARQWLDSARKQQNTFQVFSAFFSAYIALAVCATQIMGDNDGKPPKGLDETWEGKAIEDAMIIKCQEIAEFLETEIGTRIKQAIWQREIPEDENFRIIGPANDEILKQAAINLCSFFTPSRTSPLTPSEIKYQATDLSTLFRKVRNRLFHGGKMNDPEGTDAELLNKLNPLLIEIVEILQKH